MIYYFKVAKYKMINENISMWYGFDFMCEDIRYDLNNKTYQIKSLYSNAI